MAYKKKIGIIAENMIQYTNFIEVDMNLNPKSQEVNDTYRYISPYDPSRMQGIELSDFLFASDKLRDMYHFFKKVESRVR